MIRIPRFACRRQAGIGHFSVWSRTDEHSVGFKHPERFRDETVVILDMFDCFERYVYVGRIVRDRQCRGVAYGEPKIGKVEGLPCRQDGGWGGIDPLHHSSSI